MDEQALRELVRQTVARTLATASEPPRVLPLTAHASHYQYALPGSGGPCIIEPSVTCNHCGYCQSHGH